MTIGALIARIPTASRRIIVAAAVLLAHGTAYAAEPQRGAMAACRTDVATFCAGIEAGGGKKMRCLQDNRTKLSPGCAASVDARLASRAAGSGDPGAVVPPPAPGQTTPQAQPPAKGASPLPAATPLRLSMRACRTDAATLCASVERGRGGRIKCLMDNQAKLSAECTAAITAVRSQQQQQQQTNRAACTADVAKLCPDARGPARQQCLQANQAQLSPACADRLAHRAANQARRTDAPAAKP